jgi:hypothetical protein
MEAADECTAEVTVQFRQALGCGRQALENSVHLFDEVAAEARTLCLVPVARFLQIRLGFRAEDDAHDLRRFFGGDAVRRDFTSVQGRTSAA